MSMNRRDFTKLSIAAVGGVIAGASAPTQLFAKEKKPKKEVHVCRGLNSCNAQDAPGKTKCAGMGMCSTAKAHACGGENACKNQGGCAATPGQNACKGKGKCAVPLNKKAWKKARAAFEIRMKKAKKKFGPAPKAKKKQSKF